MLVSIFVGFDQRAILGLEQHVDARDHWRIEKRAGDPAQDFVGHLPAAPRA